MSFQSYVKKGTYSSGDGELVGVLPEGRQTIISGDHSIDVHIEGSLITIFPKTFKGNLITKLGVSLMDYEYGGSNSPRTIHLGPHELMAMISNYPYDGLVEEVKLNCCSDDYGRVILELEDDEDNVINIKWITD